MKIIVATGFLGSGKTTFIINLLLWLLKVTGVLPPVIVNDRGENKNLDWFRVVNAVADVQAYDLLGQCIGCGGREEFLALVRRLRDEGCKLLVVEPTGLFSLDELAAIAGGLKGCSVRSIHLVDVKKVGEAAAFSFSNLLHSCGIGLTHAHQNITREAKMLAGAVNKPVFIVEERVEDGLMAEIWERLMDDAECGHHHVHTCGDPHCTHNDHEHDHHHHEDHVPSRSFLTEGWTMGQIVAYLAKVPNLLRFKGVVQNGESRIWMGWAGDEWHMHAMPDDAPLKADVFASGPIPEPSRESLTDAGIEALAEGVAPVVLESPSGGYTRLSPVGTSAWTLFYDTSKSASAAVRATCGTRLVQRCREVATYLFEHDLTDLDPEQVDFYRFEVCMVWWWWTRVFGFELETADRAMLDRLLRELDPEQVNMASLEDWTDEDAYGCLSELKERVPEHADKVRRVEERMAAT